MTTRKFGIFKLSMDVMNPRKLHEGEWSNIFHKMFVIRAQENFVENCIEYLAIHEDFDVQVKGQMVPVYTARFQDESIYPKWVKTRKLQMNHIPFPSIGQFKDAIKQVRQSAKWAGVPVPTVTFLGTTKLHGSNGGICRKLNGTVDDIYFQSRERVITPLDDNAGFAMWAYSNRDKFNKLFDDIADEVKLNDPNLIIQVFGEWAGGNIQKGVGLNKIEKSMFVFGVRISVDAASTIWKDAGDVDAWIEANKFERFYSIYEFPTWLIDIDMSQPELSQNKLVELTEMVEADCPVARRLVGESDDELIGEGIVWTAIDCSDTTIDISGLRMKCKGEKHSASKVKTIAAVDVEKVNSINEFVEKTVTVNRLNQGLDKLREMGLEATTESTGAFIKWVMGDVLKEEIDVLAASGLTTKEVTGKMAGVAREFYLKALDA